MISLEAKRSRILCISKGGVETMKKLLALGIAIAIAQPVMATVIVSEDFTLRRYNGDAGQLGQRWPSERWITVLAIQVSRLRTQVEPSTFGRARRSRWFRLPVPRLF
ncbi:MAG: hypothetical protein R3E58_05975 [Phycisphaerae bacterium]